MPPDPPRRSTVVSVRCSQEECSAWQAYAEKRGLKLSGFMRLMANNVTGVNDPPLLDAFDGKDLTRFTKLTHGERVARVRRRLLDSEYGVAATVVICHCCLHGHDLMPSLPFL